MFDFNGDGMVDTGELALGMMMLEELLPKDNNQSRENSENNFDDMDYNVDNT